MTQPRLPRRPVVDSAAQQTAVRRAIENEVELRRIAAIEPRAVLGVVAYWLGPEFSEGANRVHA